MQPFPSEKHLHHLWNGDLKIHLYPEKEKKEYEKNKIVAIDTLNTEK